VINEVGFRRLAANLIKEYGWTQNDLGGRDRGFSLLAAIHETTPLEQVSLITWKIKGELDVEDLTTWNDDPVRTMEEVIAALLGDSEKSHSS
jgi:hypothetical protein